MTARLSANQAYLAATITGAVLWQATTMLTGRREAWDASEYWMFAYPLGVAASGAFGYLNPERPSRWGLSLMLVQAVVLAASASSFGLLPLGLIMFGMLSIPNIVVANMAARARLRRDDA